MPRLTGATGMRPVRLPIAPALQGDARRGASIRAIKAMSSKIFSAGRVVDIGPMLFASGSIAE
jgi:hypothetical protein